MQYKVKGARDRAVFCLNSDIPEHEIAFKVIEELEKSLGKRKRSKTFKQLVKLSAIQANNSQPDDYEAKMTAP